MQESEIIPDADAGHTGLGCSAKPLFRTRMKAVPAPKAAQSVAMVAGFTQENPLALDARAITFQFRHMPAIARYG